VVAAAVLVPIAARPQGRLAGLVLDGTGTGVAGAEVTVAGTRLRTETDESGAFLFTAAPTGKDVVRVRRLGFAPASADVVVSSGATASVRIGVTEVVPQLAPVVVRAERTHQYSGYLAGFYERRDQGFGRFITGTEIRDRHPMRLTDLLRTVPGIAVFSPDVGDSHVRIRNSDCAPVVWLDGMPAVAAEFDLDALVPRSVAGIEIYNGPATVPPQFVVPFGPTACGTIVIWSRTGERQRPALKEAITAGHLDTLVASLEVYTADQVDTPARAAPGSSITPRYPDALYRARVPGRVVVEFVVDTAGRAEPGTLGVVSSTDPRFTEAVRHAVPRARFTPALLHGRAVPQVVEQAVAFVMPATLAREVPR